MEKNVKSKEEPLNEKEKKLEIYNSSHTKSNKPAILTKKEKKALGIGKDEGRAILKYVRIIIKKSKNSS